MPTRLMLSRWLCCLLLCVTAADWTTKGHPTHAHAAQIHGTPASYRAALGHLQPGDDLVLEPGTYREGLPLHNVRGTIARPIRILGPKTGSPAVFVGRMGHNTVSLSNTAHVHVHHLVLDGRGLEVDAVKGEGGNQCSYVHDIVLEDLLVVGHGADQQVVGISSMCPAWNWVIRRNVIIGAGTGLYLGRPDGRAPFVAGLIEQNLLIDTRGYNLQIKHQIQRPSGGGMPSGQSQTVIRHNVFTKALNASSGVEARPNLLLGHFPQQGVGSEDVYAVANNVFFCNPGESLLQGEGNVTVTGNVFFNPDGNAVSLQPHHDVPRRVRVEGNFVAASGWGVLITRASPLHTQTIVDNWLFSSSALQGGKQRGNRIAAYPASPGALAQWLGTIDGPSTQFEKLAPLVASATRMCSGQVTERLRNVTQLHNQLDNHPVCRFVELMVSSLGVAGLTPAGSEPLDYAAQQRCN